MTDQSITTKKRERSPAYPSISLEKAVSCITKLRSTLGKGPYNRLAVAEGLGYKKLSGSSVRAVAALSHYGLLSRHGSSYSQTKLADRVTTPISDEDTNNAIIEAVQSPRLFLSLIEKYNNQSIPTMLSNILSRVYGINESVSSDVTDIFIKSITFAGILKDGIIVKIDQPAENKEGQALGDSAEDDNGNIDQKIPSETTKDDGIRIELSSGIAIIFPRALSMNLAIGDFASSVKALDEKAAEIINIK